MRIVMAYFPKTDPEKLLEMAKAVSGKLESSGHRVDIVNARLDKDARLMTYDYVIALAESSGLSGKIPEYAAGFLAQAGSLAGKRSAALVRASGFQSAKALSRLMKVMEAEGMWVNDSALVKSADEAAAVATGLPLVKA